MVVDDPLMSCLIVIKRYIISKVVDKGDVDKIYANDYETVNSN